MTDQLIPTAKTKPAIQWWQKVQQIVHGCTDGQHTWYMAIMSDHSQGYISANGSVVARVIPNIQYPNSLYLYPRASAGAVETALLSANLSRNFRILLGDPFEYDGEGFTFYGEDAQALAVLDGKRFYYERVGVAPAFSGSEGGKSGGSTSIRMPPPRLIN